MSAPISPVIAVRSAVVAAAGQTVLGASMPWYTSLAPEGVGGKYGVWASATDSPSLTPVFRRGHADVADQFTIYADASSTQVGTEIAYAIFAQLKARAQDTRLTLGSDPEGRPLYIVRNTFTMLDLSDDPDVENRARCVVRLDASVWSA